jgi:peptidoglycan/xylan/chitin deacetylase (PgdA/CDA1 family)
VVLTFDDGYEDFYTTVFPLLKKYQMKGTVYVIYDFINRPGFLKESEIKELIASGIVEIGSHTLDHKYLKTETLEEAKRQITDSKQKFEDAFGIKIRTFAYPFGAYNSEDADMVKDASYEAAFTTKPGAMMSNDAKFVLPRIRPDRYTNDSIVQGLEEYDK